MTYPPEGQSTTQDPAQLQQLHDQADAVCDTVLTHLCMTLTRYPDDHTYQRRQVLLQHLDGAQARNLGSVHERVLRVIQQTSWEHGRHMHTQSGALMPPATGDALAQRRIYEWVRNCLESIRHFLDEIHNVVADPHAYRHTMLAMQIGGGFKAATVACGVPVVNDDVYASLANDFARIIPHADSLAIPQMQEALQQMEGQYHHALHETQRLQQLVEDLRQQVQELQQQ